jgi:Uma2 family endonuclease
MRRPHPQELIYTREAYRQWCAAQNGGRYERVDGQIVAMSPERAAHARVKGRVFNALQRAIPAADG